MKDVEKLNKKTAMKTDQRQQNESELDQLALSIHYENTKIMKHLDVFFLYLPCNFTFF
jgi:hypothetical protein